MNISVASFGYNKFRKQQRHMKIEERRQFRALLTKIAKTAMARAIALSPKRTGKYCKSIKYQIISNIKARLYGEGVTMSRKENASRGTNGHGYLAGILEYGRKETHAGARPHLQKAVEYAVKVHEKDVAAYVHGIFAKTFGEFGE